MKVVYLPQVDTAYRAIRNFAAAILLYDGWTPTVMSDWEMCIHGIGERSAGMEENLRNLVEGFLQKDGKTRLWAFVNEDMKATVDQKKKVLVIPTYGTNEFFEPAKVDTVYDYIVKQYNLNPRFEINGFSYGGGAAIKYASSSPERSARIIACHAAAPTNSASNWKFAADAKTPVHIFVNTDDPNGPTNLGVTKNIVAAMNRLLPAIPATYTAFKESGHGGYNRMKGISAPVAPGGQGVTNLIENTYDHAADILINGPRQMKTGSIVTEPTTPIPQIPTNMPTAQFTATLNGSTLTLDASTSTGVKTGWDAYQWDFIPGTGSYDFKQTTGAYMSTPLKTITELKKGTYKIALTVRDKAGVAVTSTQTIAVGDILVIPTEKKPVGYDFETNVLTFDDGSTTLVSAVFTTTNGTKYTD